MNSGVTHVFVYVDGPWLAPGQWTWADWGGVTTPMASCHVCGQRMLFFVGRFSHDAEGVSVACQGKGREFVCPRSSRGCTLRGKLQLLGFAEHQPRN